MKRNLGLVVMVLALAIQAGAANAQFGNYFNGPASGLVDTGQAVDVANTFAIVQHTPSCAANTVNCVAFIPLSKFAGASQGLDQFNALNAQFNALNAQFGALGVQFNTLNAQFTALGTKMSRDIDTLNGQMSQTLELVAVAAAMKDAIPNAGDRFAVRLNAAAFNGQAAGAIGLSYNVNDMTRLSGNYGQGASQAIVSGGLNLSFR